MTTEHDVQSLALAEVSATGTALLFRNNAGMATYVDRHGKVSRVQYGVGNPGGSDLIGWRTRIVTPDMVGCRVAIFAAVEMKKPSRGITSEDQKRFIRIVLEAGGLAGRARSVDEAFAILELPR